MSLLKRIKLYMERDYHFFRAYMARFKMWRIMQLVHIVSIFSKDEEYKTMYRRMRYEFDRR